jgi:tight adherence protein B
MVIGAVAIAGALLAGAPWPAVAIVAFGLWQPGWFLVGAGVWAVVARLRSRETAGPDDEAAYLRGVAAELAAGSSLRSAVANAEPVSPMPLDRARRAAVSGRPATAVATALGEALPVNGRLAGPAYRLAADTGGAAATVFASLADRAAREGELARERRALTAQARLSAWIVAGAPATLVILFYATGRGSALLRLGFVGIVVAAVGFGLQAAGVLVVWLMLRRAER